ncbi:MAG: sigma-70 family RNA polymerase sigma factor [Myxococcales bacterium]|nr:sigma-70 family RNA polymerase sigma factor [Myxococcales bacterium]MCB9715300.1 sigma-70 family RNA polymerase sigma factor [Myxococcales bacterium]
MARPPETATAAHLRLVDDEGPSSFRCVYAEHYDAVWRTLRALGVPEAQLDDATQDVFLVVHRRLPTFDHAAPVRSWILGIARKVALKVHERRRRPPPRIAVVEPEAPSGEDQVARRDAAAIVARFLDTLEPQQREVFVLAQLEDMPVPEIAATLGIKLNTAYSRLRLARRRFDRVVARHAARRRRHP